MDQGIAARFDLALGDFRLDLDLHLPSTGLTVVFGESGSGKSTLLRCLAGLARCKKGTLQLNGECWQGDKVFLPTHKRCLGYVFQDASLLDHLSVQANLDYAKNRSKRLGSPELEASRFTAALDALDISSLSKHYPRQLSGGERQRVAIACALVCQPKLLLLDEPLASLDERRKRDILPYLERVKKALSIPIVYVTHSVTELARLADYIVLLDQGKRLAAGPAHELMSSADFSVRLAGQAGVALDVQVVERDDKWQLIKVAFDGGSIWLSDNGQELGQCGRLHLLAKDISLAQEHHDDMSILNVLPGSILSLDQDHDAAFMLVRVQIGAIEIVSRVTRRSIFDMALKKDQAIWAQIKSAAFLA